jgi:cytochrome P450
MAEQPTPVEDPALSDHGVSVDWLHGQPYAEWAAGRRAECPVVASPDSFMGPGTSYQILRYKDAETVLRDAETFSSSINGEHIGQFMGDLILAMNGPEHRTYRNLVAKAFRASQLERWDETLVRPMIDRLLDAIAPLGHADLVESVTSVYPVQVICGIAGVPLEDAAQFARWAVAINMGPLAPEEGMAASQAMVDYLRPLVEARRAEPTGDFLSDLVHEEVDGEQLTDSKIYGFLRLLLPAGAETTYRSSSNLLFGLLTNPEQLDALRADRTLMPQAIEEGLRWEPPLLTIMRTATRDTVVEGVEITAGATIVINMGSANHDETYWERADEFDMFRAPRQHLAFAFGPHMCLGLHLARMETRVVVGRLLDRLPDLRLDESAEPPFITGVTFRAPNALPVIF